MGRKKITVINERFDRRPVSRIINGFHNYYSIISQSTCQPYSVVVVEVVVLVDVELELDVEVEVVVVLVLVVVVEVLVLVVVVTARYHHCPW